MRTLLSLAMTAALVACGVGPALGQSAPAKDELKVAQARQKEAEAALQAAQEAEAKRKAQLQLSLQAALADAEKQAAERKAAEEKLRYAREVQDAHQKLKAELEARARELEKLRDQLADEAKKKAATIKEGVLSKPQPPQPATGVVRWAAEQPVADPLAAIKPLIRSDDPKVAMLAAQLAEALAKKAPQPKPPVVVAGQLHFEGAGQTLRLESKPVATSEPLKVVVSTDKVVKVAEPVSSLRMSADGKTAAVIAADGSVTVFDAASGKELMRFPVKK
jgi:hypothetical protein